LVILFKLTFAAQNLLNPHFIHVTRRRATDSTTRLYIETYNKSSLVSALNQIFNKYAMSNNNPTSPGGAGWQSLNYEEVWQKIRWTGDPQDFKMLLERGDALGLTRKCTNPRDRMKHSYSPEFFNQIDNARDGLLGFIVSGNPGFHYSADPRVPRPLESVRRQIYVPGRQPDLWDLRRQRRGNLIGPRRF
jgi:hypothetical protein